MTATAAQSVLRYQRNRTLGEVPGLTAGIQVRLSGGGHVYVALSPAELSLYFDQPEHALHYDLDGRLLKVAEPNVYHRRGLSHRVLVTRKRPKDEGGGVERGLLADSADAVVDQAQSQAVKVLARLNDGALAIEFGKPSVHQAVETLTPLLERATKFGVEAARADAQRFNQMYGRVAILPPDQYNALVLQATEGCAYGGCLFCELYRGVFYDCKTTEQFRQHVRDAVAFHGEGLRARRSILLGQANALALPEDTLREFFGVLHEHFEFPPAEQNSVPVHWWYGSKTRFDGVSSFLDVFTGKSHTAPEFHRLREHGLRRVYIGLETGSNDLLRWLCKPATAERMQRCVHALKEARIAVGVIVLLGAGGRAFDAAHRQQTAEVLNELSLSTGDYIYFSPLVIYCGSRYDEESRALGVEPLTPQEMREQEQAIRAALRFDPQRGRPYVARYELETFVY
ncbi:MAG TPA: radical SAM protein [Verrucomicrobiae bacterium]|nr:radical SAM protein [Verrucomicrobiae bacterium]